MLLTTFLHLSCVYVCVGVGVGVDVGVDVGVGVGVDVGVGVGGDALLCKLCVTYPWRHRWHRQVKSRSKLKIVTTWSVFIALRGNKYCQYLWLTWHLYYIQISVSVCVWKIVRGRKSKPFSRIFKIHVLHMIASIWLQIWKLDVELCIMKPWYFHHDDIFSHGVTLNIALYIHV